MPGIGEDAPDVYGNDIINNNPNFALHDYLGKVILLSFVYCG
jgi:hypothetical protein